MTDALRFCEMPLIFWRTARPHTPEYSRQ